MNNWTEVSEHALAANYRVLTHAAGPAAEVLAVIKADGYGHGAEICAPMLVRAGARWLGVTCASEGARVRSALAAAEPGRAGEGAGRNGNRETSLLVMCGSLPGDAALLVRERLTPVVWTAAQLGGLPPGMAVHVEIDTGMGRQGVLPGVPLGQLLAGIAARELVLEGLFTHFCSSEVVDDAGTEEQKRRFETACEQVRAAGFAPRLVHAGNSSTLDNPGQTGPWLASLAGSLGARPMVRTGLALYGYTLALAGHGAAAQVGHLLQPVLCWRAYVLAVHTLAAGATVGYNATFTADRDLRTAVLAVGYADGLRRAFSGPAGWVMLHGKRARVLGRISMNLTVVDVTELEEVNPGDAATVLGPGITADDHARLAGTIPYEILCGIHPCC